MKLGSRIREAWTSLVGERRNANDPSKPLTWDELAELFGVEAASGVKINNDVALSLAPVWRAVSLIAKAIAKTNIQLIPGT